MEMIRDKFSSKVSSENASLLRPSPFDADQERQDLHNISAPAPSINSVESPYSSQDVVATAVPISDDTFGDNICPMATATAVTFAQGTGTQAPPPPSSSSQSSKNTKEEHDEVLVSPLPPNTNLPSAPAISTYTTPTTHQHTTASLLRQAQHRGFIETEIDKTKDMLAKAQLQNLRNDTAAALERAKVNAQKAKRSDEGLTVDEGIHNNYPHDSTSNAQREEEPTRPFGTTKDGKRGYEVAEYDVAEYDTSEYDVAEYRSVYD
jgi:hypothetical protein